MAFKCIFTLKLSLSRKGSSFEKNASHFYGYATDGLKNADYVENPYISKFTVVYLCD